MLRREAELSSRIEGTRANLQTLVLFPHMPEVETDTPDVREVDNNFTALLAGLSEVETRPITLNLVRGLHKLLLADVRGHDKTRGVFRNVQAFIGRTDYIDDARFVPAPPHLIESAMQSLEQYIRVADDIPPLARIAMAHYQFEAIHPFADGNGRIGRVLIMLMLRTEGLLPWPLINVSAPLEERRSEYYDLLLEVSQRGSWGLWIEFFANCVADETVLAIERVEAIEALREQLHERFIASRSSALLPRAIDHLFAEHAVTINSLADALGIGYSSAKSIAQRLVREGVIEEITGKARSRVFLAREVLNTISTGRVRSNRPREGSSATP